MSSKNITLVQCVACSVGEKYRGGGMCFRPSLSLTIDSLTDGHEPQRRR